MDGKGNPQNNSAPHGGRRRLCAISPRQQLASELEAALAPTDRISPSGRNRTYTDDQNKTQMVPVTPDKPPDAYEIRRERLDHHHPSRRERQSWSQTHLREITGSRKETNRTGNPKNNLAPHGGRRRLCATSSHSQPVSKSHAAPMTTDQIGQSRKTRTHPDLFQEPPAPESFGCCDSKKDRECNFRQYGDKLEPKAENTIRIYSQNINGISAESMQANLTKNLDAMLDRQVDIMGWAETNLEWNDYSTHLLAQRVFRKQYPGGKWLTTTSKIPSKTNLKPGGNALGLNHDATSRTTSTGRDSMGRWLWATLEGKTDSVTIVQLYVPGDPSTQGITTTYAQQYEQIQLANRQTVPDVIGQYYRDLHTFLDTLKTQLIVMGDFNEGPTDKHLLNLQSRHNLRDVYDMKHPDSPLNTHQMGTQQIDHFLVTAPLLAHITKVGYEEIAAGIPSDHRGMYLDLSRQAIRNTTKAQNQKLRADHSRKVLKYRKKLVKFIDHKKLIKRLQTLEHQSDNNQWNQQDTKHLQTVDKEFTQGMLNSEKTSRPCHLAPWSKQTGEQMVKLRQIYTKIRQICPRQNSTGARYPVTTLIGAQKTTLHKLMEIQKDLIKNIHKVRAQGYDNRCTYLEEKADIEEIKGNASRTQIIKNILNVEELRHLYGHISYILKDGTRQSLTKVQYPTTSGWTKTTTMEDLEQRLVHQQRTHFSQSNTTPLALDGRVYNIPIHAYPRDIMSMDLPDTSQGLKKFFLRGAATPEISMIVHMTDFIQGIQKWKEKTSTSPSGRHLGHYHAQILPPMNNEALDIQSKFLRLHLGIINLAIKHQITLSRWIKVDTLCIPKDAGIPKMTRLRPLNLYEADLNLVLRQLVARKLTWNAEDNHLLPEDNWGGRQLRSAGNLGLQRVLTMQMSTLTRTTLGQIDLDAKSCYDRIIRPVAILACYKFGLPIHLCCWLIQVMESQQHHIITTNGRSKQQYSSTPECRLHGVGQGSSSAPTIWLLISSVLFLSMQKWAQGVHSKSPHPSPALTRYTDAFVDNTALWANNIEDPKALVQKMEEDLKNYQEMLTWTGGALTLEKCFFSVLAWRFQLAVVSCLGDSFHDAILVFLQQPKCVFLLNLEVSLYIF